MKRSEMVRYLYGEIENFVGSGEELAENILKFIEQLGMAPPNVKVHTERLGDFNYDRHWEPENETK